MTLFSFEVIYSVLNSQVLDIQLLSIEVSNEFKMFSSFLVILGMTSSLASDYEMCTKFMTEDSNRIGLYHKYYSYGNEVADEYLVFKHNSTEMWKMSIDLDESRDVRIGVSDKSDKWTDTKDVYKFSLNVNQDIWNCSLKYVLFFIFKSNLQLIWYLNRR